MSKGHTSVRAQKCPRLSDGEPWQKLELFPTPPWATRALFVHVLPRDSTQTASAWEPCAGLGHMAFVLDEFFRDVRASDVFNYPLAGAGAMEDLGVETLDFTDRAAVDAAPAVDWIVSNPPFGKAAEMLDIALSKARRGVAFLLRMQWLEGGERYEQVYAKRAPTLIAPFAERVPMCEGGWDPDGSSATMYAWFVWKNYGAGWSFADPQAIPIHLIPPGREAALSERDDRLVAARFVPGWIPPSTLKKTGRDQLAMELHAP